MAAASREFDVIIVGARVAGSAAAILLARAGLKVLMLDKAAFPSDTISTHIVLAGGAQVLRRIGALEVLERAGGFRFGSMRTLGRGFDFQGSLTRDGNDLRGICLGRERMDSVMLDLARSHDSITMRESLRVADLITKEGAIVGVRGENKTGAESFSAPLVIGADGMRSAIASLGEQQLGAFERSDVPCARAYYYGYYEGVAADRLGDELITEFDASPGAGNLICRCEDGRVVAAAAFDAREMQSFKRDLSGNLRRHLDGSLAIGKLLRDATLSGPVRSSGVLKNTYRDPIADGGVLIGDAGLHVDPLFGQGHSMALISAEILGQLAPSWFSARRGNSIGAATMRLFNEQRDAALMPYYRASERISRDLSLDPASEVAYKAASSEQWAADEMVQFAQMVSERKFPSLRFGRLMAQQARAA